MEKTQFFDLYFHAASKFLLPDQLNVLSGVILLRFHLINANLYLFVSARFFNTVFIFLIYAGCKCIFFNTVFIFLIYVDCKRAIYQYYFQLSSLYAGCKCAIFQHYFHLPSLRRLLASYFSILF